MLKKKPLIAAMSAALAVGAMFSGSAHAVRISENTTGQVLLGDMYIARATDYNSTRVTVVNPSMTDAVKAKLVFRSKKHSDECKDLILYLTPGDVAYVDVRLNSAGQPEIWSDDDSILASRRSDGTVQFASQITGGFTSPMVLPRTQPAADTCAQGHVEVVGAYAVGGTVTGLASGAPNVVIAQGMSKHQLIRVFDTNKGALNAAGNNITNDGAARGGQDHADRVRLKGDITIASATDRVRASMAALREGVNQRTAGVSTFTITNPTFDVTVGAETLIGENFSLAGDTVTDISGALSTTNLFNFYAKGSTGFEVTFSTKYRYMNPADRYANRASSTLVNYSPPFEQNGEVQYNVALWDTQERSAPALVTDVCIVSPCSVSVVAGSYLIHEVNYEALTGTSTWDPSSGWFRMNLVPRAGVDRFGANWTAANGVPASGWTHYYAQSGVGMNSTTSVFGRP
jgi:hypothetical protein